MSTASVARQVEPRPFVSLLGAVCVLVGGTALSAVISGGGWAAPTIQVVGLVWLVGVGCRLLGSPAPVTVVAQAVAVALTLTAVFTSGGWLGLIPNAEVGRQASRLLTGAWDEILHSTLPAPSTQNLSFLIAIALGLIAVIVDFFVAEVNAAALVALPLLCLYSIPASIADDLLPWWTFALPALCYAALIAVAGHPGRRVGMKAGLGVLLAGGLVAGVAVAGSVVVADQVTAVGTAGRLAEKGPSSGSSTIGLSTFASLHGDLQQSVPRNVLRVRGMPVPDYLRVTALETWDAQQGFSPTDPANGAVAIGNPADLTPLAVNPSSIPAEVSVEVLDFKDKYLPLFQGTTRVTGLGDGYSYNRDLGSVFRSSSSTPANYQLSLQTGAIDPEALRADGVQAVPRLTDTTGVPDAAFALAREVTASGQTAFDKALLLKNYFTDPTNGFVYSLSVPVGNSGSLLMDFLQNKRGYCEQYAVAMAILLRTLGIPARVAIGFTQGQSEGDQQYLITSQDAHAWVEVLFQGAGWVRFDPTPLSTDIAGQQGFATSVEPTPTDATSAAGSVPNQTANDPEATQPVATVTSTQTVDVGATGVGQGPSFWKPWFTWTLVVLAVLALIVALPTLLRRRLSRRRLALAQAGGSGAAGAAWAEVEALVVDHGLPSRRSASVRKAANHLARDGKLGEPARAGLRRIALAAEAAWYSPVGYVPEQGEDLAEDVRRIAVDLEHHSPRTLGTRLLPRSLVARR